MILEQLKNLFETIKNFSEILKTWFNSFIHTRNDRQTRLIFLKNYLISHSGSGLVLESPEFHEIFFNHMDEKQKNRILEIKEEMNVIIKEYSKEYHALMEVHMKDQQHEIFVDLDKCSKIYLHGTVMLREQKCEKLVIEGKKIALEAILEKSG